MPVAFLQAHRAVKHGQAYEVYTARQYTDVLQFGKPIVMQIEEFEVLESIPKCPIWKSLYLVSMEIKFDELFAALQWLNVSDKVVREDADPQRDAGLQVLHGLQVKAIILHKNKVFLIFYYIFIIMTPLLMAGKLLCDCSMKHLSIWVVDPLSWEGWSPLAQTGCQTW